MGGGWWALVTGTESHLAATGWWGQEAVETLSPAFELGIGRQRGKTGIARSEVRTHLFLPSNPECRYVASSSKDGSVRVWDTTAGRCERTLTGHAQSVTCLRWGGDGLLYSASQDRTIKVWRAHDVRARRGPEPDWGNRGSGMSNQCFLNLFRELVREVLLNSGSWGQCCVTAESPGPLSVVRLWNFLLSEAYLGLSGLLYRKLTGLEPFFPDMSFL